MKELEQGVWEVTMADVALPRRARDAYKGMFGRVCILGGAVGYSGAPVLAAKAAVRTGSGLVSVLVPEPIWESVAARLTCAMPWPLPADSTSIKGDGLRVVTLALADGTLSKEAFEPALKKMEGCDGVLIGPGMGRSKDTAWVIRKLIPQVKCPLVLDADGINALSGHIDVLDSRKGLSVLTPHDGEFARLGVAFEEDRVGAARAFAAAHQCVLVLKGHRTITAFPDGEVFVNTTGNPGMATGGSGDVLAGMILSLLGQGLEPKQAVVWAVCLHGAAGDCAAEKKGEYSMTPLDLIEEIPTVMKGF